MKTERVGVLSELDIYRSAKLLIDQHGEDAAIHAAQANLEKARKEVR